MVSVESRAQKPKLRARQQATAAPRAWDEDSWLAIRWRLRREPWAGAEVRVRLVLATTGMLSEDEQDLLRLLVTELINNSVQHAGADAGTHLMVDISVTDTRLRAMVCDGGEGFDVSVAVPAPAASTALRGLQLVERLSARWGVCSDGGSCVWFELDQDRRG